MARGARLACTAAAKLLADDAVSVPPRLRAALLQLRDEIRELEQRVHAIDRELAEIAATNIVMQRLQRIPGIGLLTASALVATVGRIDTFRTARHFAAGFLSTTVVTLESHTPASRGD